MHGPRDPWMSGVVPLVAGKIGGRNLAASEDRLERPRNINPRFEEDAHLNTRPGKDGTANPT